MKYFFRYISLIITSILVILFHTTCTNKESEDDGRTVFNYNEMAGVSSLDPAISSNLEIIWPVNQLFNGLVQMNDSLKVIPSIAKRWWISDDGLSYTFILRNDVYFHDNKC